MEGCRWEEKINGSQCDREGKDAECDLVGKISRRGDEKERFIVGWRRIDFTEC